MDRPKETAAHEHSHVALYIYPNKFGTPGASISSKSQGANESSTNAQGRTDTAKAPVGNEQTNYKAQCLILSGRTVKGWRAVTFAIIKKGKKLTQENELALPYGGT